MPIKETKQSKEDKSEAVSVSGERKGRLTWGSVIETEKAQT